jgi:hypothetical protein
MCTQKPYGSAADPLHHALPVHHVVPERLTELVYTLLAWVNGTTLALSASNLLQYNTSTNNTIEAHFDYRPLVVMPL